MSDFLINLALRGAGIPAPVQLAPSRSAMLASEPGMFPGIEVPVTTAASPAPSGARPAAPDSAGIVQRQPAAVSPAPMARPPAPASAAPSPPVIPMQANAAPSALSPVAEASSPSGAEPSPTPPASPRVAEFHQPNEVAVRDTSRVSQEPDRASPPAEFEARAAEKMVVPSRVEVEQPLPSAEPPSSRVVPPSAPQVVEAAAPPAPLRTAEVMQARPAVEEPGPQEAAQERPRPAPLPEPVVAVESPPTAPTDEGVRLARPVEVRIGHIEVRVNSQAAAPPAIPAPEMAPAHAAEGAGFDVYDAIRGYRIPTVW